MSGVIFRWSWYYKGRLRLPESWSRAPPGFCIRPRGALPGLRVTLVSPRAQPRAFCRGFALPLFLCGHGPGPFAGVSRYPCFSPARPRALTEASRYPCFSPGLYQCFVLPLFLPQHILVKGPFLLFRVVKPQTLHIFRLLGFQGLGPPGEGAYQVYGLFVFIYGHIGAAGHQYDDVAAFEFLFWHIYDFGAKVCNLPYNASSPSLLDT